MRIAISGTGNQGKTTLINDFLQEWSNYKTESSTYRDKLVAEKLPHSKDATKDTQWKILNHMIDEMQIFGAEDNIIMDRCPIDSLIYSLWCFEKGVGDIDKEFIDKCIPLVCESMRNLDIIFFIPITKAAPVAIEEDGVRETDKVYIKEIDNIFKMIGAQHHENNGRNPFFPKDDAPGWIEVFGDRQTRVAMIKQYLDADGDLIGGTEESMNELINPHDGQSTDEARQQMNNLLKDQEKASQFATDLADQKQQIKEMLGDDDVISLSTAYEDKIKL
jgi:hypothetical protein